MQNDERTTTRESEKAIQYLVDMHADAMLEARKR